MTAVAEVVGLLVTVGFIVSLLYDQGFFASIGIYPAVVPMTIADHFSTGLLWFPRFLALSLLCLAFEFQFRRVEQGFTEQEILESSKNPKALRRFREWPYVLFKWIAFLGVALWFLFGVSLPSIFAAVVWGVFAEWCYSAPLIKQRRLKAVQLMFTYVPIIGIIAYFSGINDGRTSMESTERAVTISRNAEPSLLQGKILRTLESGVLLLQDEKVTYLPWDQIQIIQSNKLTHPFRGILCEWLNVCPTDNGVAPADSKHTAH